MDWVRSGQGTFVIGYIIGAYRREGAGREQGGAGGPGREQWEQGGSKEQVRGQG